MPQYIIHPMLFFQTMLRHQSSHKLLNYVHATIEQYVLTTERVWLTPSVTVRGQCSRKWRTFIFEAKSKALIEAYPLKKKSRPP